MCIRDRGAHVGQGDLPVRRARELLGATALLGLSVNSTAELAAAADVDPDRTVIDYLGLGIYRPTATKPDHAPAAGPAHIADLAAGSPWPTCAIGGVKAVSYTHLDVYKRQVRASSSANDRPMPAVAPVMRAVVMQPRLPTGPDPSPGSCRVPAGPCRTPARSSGPERCRPAALGSGRAHRYLELQLLSLIHI